MTDERDRLLSVLTEAEVLAAITALRLWQKDSHLKSSSTFIESAAAKLERIMGVTPHED